MAIEKNGRQIVTLDEWFREAPPKGRAKHWVDGRSAKEAARAWLEAGAELPPEVASALNSNVHLGAVSEWQLEPEARLRFDGYAGEVRNSDLAGVAHTTSGPVLLAVEAKADETFGETLQAATGSAVANLVGNRASQGLPRIHQLVLAVLGTREEGRREALKLRYQLLTATAGALCEAERRKCRAAVLLVHEFRSAQTSDKKLKANATDLEAFVAWVSQGQVASVRDGEIVGPFMLPGVPLFSDALPLYLGKAVRDIR